VADVDWDTTAGANFVKTAYERMAAFALRPELYFDAVAKKKPSDSTLPGTPVTFNFYPDMDVATSALNEVTDPEFVTVTPTTKTVSLVEYGNVARTTKLYRGLSYSIPGPDSEVANLIGYNAGLSQDTLARDVLIGGTNVTYAGNATTRFSIDAADTFTASKARYVAAKLRGGNAKGWNNGAYAAFIHPDVAVDLMSETGVNGWVTPAGYSASDRVWNGVIGRFAGVDFIETPRAAVIADAANGSSTTGTVDVYITVVVGQEALAKAYSKAESGASPTFVVGPAVDRLRRHHTFGWYWLGGYGRYREAALYRVESASSIGTNV